MVISIRKSTYATLLAFLAMILSSQNSQAQYCTPSYWYPCSWYYMYINSFSTTGGSTNISSNNTACSNPSTSYTYYSTRVHTGIQGQTVNFTLANCPWYSMTYRIWVDFNGDGDFTDAGEQVYSNNLSYGGTASSSFTIPATATPGNTRLRVRAGYQWSSAPQPCGSAYYGECEDYGFVIVPACSTSFTQQPDINAFACENGPGELSVDASNGAAYQWQVNNGGTFVNLANGTNYADVNTKTLKMINIPSNFAGKQYRCLVTPNCNSNVKNSSDTVTLSVRPNIKLLSQTTKDTSCIGLSTILSYKADDSITESKWQISTAGTNGFIDITGPQFMATDDSLFISNLPDTLNGAKIRCTFKGICGTITTQDMTMSVNALPAVITAPQDVYVKQGQTATFQVVAAGIGVKYQWQANSAGNFANINNNGIYSGVKTDKLTITGAARAQNGFEYRCVVSGSGSCAVTPDISEFAVLNVEPPASVQELASDNNITIFPNPATGNEVVIRVDEELREYLSTYLLTDKVGKTISVGNMVNNSNNTTVNIAKLVPDVYFIQIMDKDNVVVKAIKFTKQ